MNPLRGGEKREGSEGRRKDGREGGRGGERREGSKEKE